MILVIKVKLHSTVKFPWMLVYVGLPRIETNIFNIHTLLTKKKNILSKYVYTKHLAYGKNNRYVQCLKLSFMPRTCQYLLPNLHEWSVYVKH